MISDTRNDALAVLGPTARERARQYADAFESAQPFRHVLIEDFLDPALARELLAEFPAFGEENALNEYGKVGGKAVVTGIRSLGPAYARLDGAIAQPAFLAWLGALTGIDGLQYDESYFGGGTHENRDGQALDPHVDFNYHPTTGLHRRLNVIVYLNEEWDESWGGNIEVHSNPRDPERNEIRAYAPAFNRCIVFETHESSWHGFRRIRLPDGKKHLSRKSVSLYFYSATRPAHTRAASHGTFYIPRPLKDVVSRGDVLDGARYDAVGALIAARDQYIEHYQRQEVKHGEVLENVRAALDQARRAILIPASGSLQQLRETSGVEPDGWIGRSARAAFRALGSIAAVRVRGHGLPGAPPLELTVRANGTARTVGVASDAAFALDVPLALGAGEIVRLELEASAAHAPAALGLGPDQRALSWHVAAVEGVPRA
jgi:hypothetical protein